MYTRSTVVGVFDDRNMAERAIDDLRRAGFDDDRIGFAVRNGTAPQGVVDTGDAGTRAGEGAVTGMVTGSVLGGLLAAGASLLIPGVGPVIGGGILATVLGGAAAGAAAGGVLGALTGLGVPEEEARYYEGEFTTGRVLVTVRAESRAAEAADILRRHGAYDMDTGRPEMRSGAAAAGQRQSSDDVIDNVRRGSSVAEMQTGAPTPTHTGDIATERVRAYAAHPMSAALEDTASATAGTPVPGRPPAGESLPTEHAPDRPSAAAAGKAAPRGRPETSRRPGQKAGTPAPTTPAGQGATGPTQQHERASDMIYGRAEDGSMAEDRDVTTQARRRQGIHDVAERSGAEPPAQSREPVLERGADESDTARAEGARASAAEQRLHAGGPGHHDGDTQELPRLGQAPALGASMAAGPASTAGPWPTRVDDTDAGKYVEGEEQIATTMTPPAMGNRAGESTGTTSSRGRAPDAARGDGPYMDPEEDLERVGATTGMASRGRMAWAEASSGYRQRWQARTSGSGGRWEDAEPGYRYGHEMAADPRYHGRQWNDVRADLGTGYAAWRRQQGYHAEFGWDRMEEYARDAWEPAHDEG